MVMRDYQKNKVYRWEDEHIDSMDQSLVSPDNYQAIVGYVWESCGLKHPPLVSILPKNTKNIIGRGNRTEIKLKETGINAATIIHETIHSMLFDIEGRTLFPAHGKEFVGLYINVLSKMMGWDLMLLKYGAARYGVDYDLSAKPLVFL